MTKFLKIFLCTCGVLMYSQSTAYATVTKLSSVDLTALQNATNFHEIHSKKDLPEEIIILLDVNKKIADKEESWEKTDSVFGDNPIFKHFIWAYASDDYYVIHYEKGGFAYSALIFVAKIDKNTKKITMTWYGLVDYKIKPLKNFPDFIKSLKNGKITDSIGWH